MERFKKVLVHVDSRQETHPALDTAIEIAARHGAELTLLDVIPEFSWPARLFVGSAERIVEEVSQAKQKKLHTLRDQVRQRGLKAECVLYNTATSVSLIQEAIKGDYDLVVKTAKGTHSRKLGVFGTTATRLLRKCPCPVLLTRAGQSPHWRHVVAAVDAAADDSVHAELNNRIVDFAQTFSSADDCRLNVIYAWTLYGESLLKEHMKKDEFDLIRHKAEKHAEHQLDDLVSRFGMGIRDDNVQVVHGDPSECVADFVDETGADLLVLGTVGRRGIAGLLMGNTADHLFGNVNCPILALKPGGFVSPIRPPAAEQKRQFAEA